MADLPAFNPDLDAEGTVPPPAVARWRRAIAETDALLICSPEYAHGVPGALNNALDWLVSGPDVPGLPVAIVTATTRAHLVHASLIEPQRTRSSRVPAGCTVRAIPARSDGNSRVKTSQRLQTSAAAGRCAD